MAILPAITGADKDLVTAPGSQQADSEQEETKRSLRKEIRRRQSLALIQMEIERRKEAEAPQAAEPGSTMPNVSGASLIDPTNGLNNAEAALVSVGKGMTNVARGAQRLFAMLPIGENFTTNNQAEADRLQQEGANEDAAFQSVRDEFPITAFIGEVAGEVAAMPIGGVGTGAVRVASAAPIVASAAMAAEAGKGSNTAEIGVTGAIAGVLGPVGEMVAPFIAKNGSKGVAFLKSLYRGKTGKAMPTEFLTPDGQITEAGQKAIGELGITEQEFRAGLDDFGDLIDPALNDAQGFRLARAESEDVHLTRGQAEQSGKIQADERVLAKSPTNEGAVASELLESQTPELSAAHDRFIAKIAPDPTSTKTSRGASVSKAVGEVEDRATEAVNQTYAALRKMEGGNQAIGDVKVPVPEGMRGRGKTIRELYVSAKEAIVRQRAPDKTLIKGLDDLFKDFELIPLGEKEAKSATHFGKLTFANAFEFRQRLGKLAAGNAERIPVIADLKGKFDDAFNLALDQFPDNAPFKVAADNARKQAAEVFDTFEAKDIIEELNSFRKGTRADKVPDSVVLEKIFSGNGNKLENVKLLRGVLVTGKNATEESKRAYSDITTQATLDIVDGAVDMTTGTLNGRKLQQNIARFGEEALDVLFKDNPGQMIELRKLVEIVGDVTNKPGGRSTRPISGKVLDAISGWFGAGVALKHGFIFRQAASNVVSTIGESVNDTAWRREVLEGMATGASPEAKMNAITRLLTANAAAKGSTAAIEDQDINALNP